MRMSKPVNTSKANVLKITFFRTGKSKLEKTSNTISRIEARRVKYIERVSNMAKARLIGNEREEKPKDKKKDADNRADDSVGSL